MNLKKKLLASTATIAVGAMATIGGTFAYFSDDVSAQSKFTNGKLDLQPEAPYLEHFTLDKFKPGDKLVAMVDNQEPAMVLNNQGNLPMNVFMKADVTDHKGSKDHIWVNKLFYGDTNLLAKYPAMDANNDSHVTLAELSSFFKGNTTLNGKSITGVGKYIGYLDAPGGAAGTNPIQAVKYELEFKDNGQDQNNLQEDETNIGFTFTGLQYEGKTLDSSTIDNGSEGGGGNFQRTDNINDREETKNDK
ncbi:TasA family protein [Fictibacillus sp. KU28468]|uniref:TasA family protein n=1 Tax=Fictibacillus sp. KU28468 TaxID=2991053 RepID=UPI00223D12FE|nr:TasA family protein [Fictibacillus sp. KU28468]UZJ80077.1 CalY family protein [Fictibacillus sp. KU28468]